VRLAPNDALAIERRLEENPALIDDRMRLLDYYAAYRFDYAQNERRKKHVFWLIEHDPASPLLRSESARLWVAESGYAVGKELWLRIVRERGTEPEIYRNAARYFTNADNALATDLLEKGAVLSPDDTYFPLEAANVLLQDAKRPSLPRQEAIVSAARAVANFEKAFQRMRPTPAQLASVTEAAFRGELWDKALELARVAIATTDPLAVHYGHWIRGELAWRDGDLARAKEELHASAKRSGPLHTGLIRMNLAEKLLKAGENDAVLAYLDAGGTAWPAGARLFREWSILIQNGFTPNFGANSR